MAGLSNPSLWMGLAGAILSIVLVTTYLRSLVGQWRDLDRTWKSRFALGRSGGALALAALCLFR